MRILIILLWLSVFFRPVWAGTEQLFSLVSLDEAVRMIIQQGNNKVLATKTATVENQKIYIIKVLTPEGRIQHIKIDADSGRTIK